MLSEGRERCASVYVWASSVVASCHLGRGPQCPAAACALISSIHHQQCPDPTDSRRLAGAVGRGLRPLANDGWEERPSIWRRLRCCLLVQIQLGPLGFWPRQEGWRTGRSVDGQDTKN